MERGIRGEVKAVPLSEAAYAIPAHTDVQILFPSGKREVRKIRSIRNDRGFLIVFFEGVDSRSEAALLRNAVIEMGEKDLPALPENEYYHRQIIGLAVITSEGNEIGRVTEIMETGSNDVYIVKGQGKEYLIPAIKDIVTHIDLASGTITITPLHGLLN